MKTRGEKWSDEEIQLVKQLYSEGVKISDMVSKVNHSVSAISHKLKSLNLSSRRTDWTDNEYIQLKELFNKGLSYPEIAKQLNKSVRACQAKAIRLGLKKKECNVWKDRVREDFWTSENIELLKQCVDKGYTRKEIASELKRSERAVNCKMTELGFYLKEKTLDQESKYRRVYSVNDDYFEDINTQKKAYFLGWMITDGYVSDIFHTRRGNVSSSRVGLKIKNDDLYVLEEFNKETNSTFPIRYVKERKPYIFKNKITGEERIIRGSPQSVFEVSSHKMAKDLARYEVIPRKTYTVKFPKLLKKEFYPGFIAGVISGDGSVNVKVNHGTGLLIRTEFAGTEDLLSNIKNILVEYIGVDSERKVRKVKSSKCLFNLELNQTETIKLYYWLKENGIQLMKRKNDIIEEFIKSKNNDKTIINAI